MNNNLNIFFRLKLSIKSYLPVCRITIIGKLNQRNCFFITVDIEGIIVIRVKC